MKKNNFSKSNFSGLIHKNFTINRKYKFPFLRSKMGILDKNCKIPVN